MNKLSRHEKALTIKGKNGKTVRNPNEITINQHIIPRKHLLEWSIDGKIVKVYEPSSGDEKRLAVSSPYFCVMRLWDQWAEVEMLGTNEDNYQKQLRLFKEKQPFTHYEHIMAYYVMLCVRTWVANKERPHYLSMMTNLSSEPTKAELEDNELEMAGEVHLVMTNSNENSQHMARQVVKDTMSQAFIQWCLVLKDQKWKVFQSEEEQFILPDSLHNSFSRNLHILPVSPNYVLILDLTYKRLKENSCLDVKFINKLFIDDCKKYYIFT